MSDKPAETPGQPSAAEIATRETEIKEEIQAAKDKPVETVKDQKWVETEISRLEDELFNLRKMRKDMDPAPKPAKTVPDAKTVKSSFLSGWDCNDLN